jgi:hypothetical protein
MSADFVFDLRRVEELQNPERHIRLGPADFALLNPNTHTCPVFRTHRDATITKSIYLRVPILLNEKGEASNAWRVSFRQGLFNMTSAFNFFRTRQRLEAQGWKLEGNVFQRGENCYLPLYEAKMLHQFDHRFGDYRDKQAKSGSNELPTVPQERLEDRKYVPLPRYWASEDAINERLAGRWDCDWLLCWRDFCRAFDERTVIASVLPRVACGDTLLLMFPQVSPALAACMLACLCSFILDYVARQKIGGNHLKYPPFKQLPILAPAQFAEIRSWLGGPATNWVRTRVLELTYTACDLQGFARDLGWEGPPFRWDEDRRSLLRAELDAAFFHLYGINRDDTDYILETFFRVKKNDEECFGTYRTKHQILDLYDRMARAMETGVPYETVLDPPPADPRVAHEAEL